MLKFDSVSIGYHKVPLIKNLSVEIPTGSITTIVGPNGCGKTTLISVLNKSSQLFNGSITLDGEDIYHMSGHLRAQKIAFLPQIREVIPALPVHTLVEHGRFPYLGFSRRLTEEDRRLVEDAMEFTHVTDYRNVATDTLSGGIRQRVFFAMTLAQNCDTIILDEPTTFLDLVSQNNFYRMLPILKAQGKTILLVLHDLAKALTISDKLIVMESGAICFQGTPDECVQTNVLNKVFHTSLKTFSDAEGTYYFFE